MNSVSRPVVLVFSDYYLPGYKSGGGMRTIVNMVERLGNRYDFRVATRDHDGPRDRRQYESVRIDGWNQIGNAKVFYLSKGSVRISRVRKIIKEVQPDLIYTNSFFARFAVYIMKLRKAGAIANVPVVIAPCGELSSGALSLKRFKKNLFIKYASALKLYDDVIWKASGPDEADEIRILGFRNSKVLIAPDLTPERIFAEFDQGLKPAKEKGKLKLVFSSRFVRKKNFNWLIPLLVKIKGEIQLDIIAPIEDKAYWRQAQDLCETLPKDIRVRSLGSVKHKRLFAELAKYHFFICPTMGENFGHIVLESMAAGCPVILSDRTPWKGLKTLGVGWDIPLESPEEWMSVIQKCVEMENEEYCKLSMRARAFSEEWVGKSDILKATEKVLEHSLGTAG